MVFQVLQNMPIGHIKVKRGLVMYFTVALQNIAIHFDVVDLLYCTSVLGHVKVRTDSALMNIHGFIQGYGVCRV